MTVTELIEHLKQFPPDEVVYIANGVSRGAPIRKEDVEWADLHVNQWGEPDTTKRHLVIWGE